MAVCAVADRPVGVDTEKKGIDPGGIGEICFRPREREWISASPDPEEAFIRLWTRKESYLKLTGTGLAVAPDTFSVLPGEAPEDGIAWKEERVGEYLICVCTRGERKVIFRPWRYGAEFT
jgi:4'-phosphopantetheinyl transferase